VNPDVEGGNSLEWIFPFEEERLQGSSLLKKTRIFKFQFILFYCEPWMDVVEVEKLLV
jgi:hypothetical protein